MSSVEVTNGVITVTYGTPEVNAQITGKTLDIVPYLTPDNSVAWKCGDAQVPAGAPTAMGGTSTGGSLVTGGLQKYLPSACRQ